MTKKDKLFLLIFILSSLSIIIAIPLKLLGINLFNINLSFNLIPINLEYILNIIINIVQFYLIIGCITFYEPSKLIIKYDPGETGNGNPTLYLLGGGSYLIVRDIEFTNSQTNRIDNAAMTEARGDAIDMVSPHSKVINCVLHDSGQGIFPASNGGADSEVYGNLIYYNGEYAPVGEPNCGAAIDLIPAAGTPVALSGNSSGGEGTNDSTLTFAHNSTTDYLVVVAAVAHGATNHTGITATYNGTSMTRYNGILGGTGPVAIFGLANPTAGSWNVVVNYSQGGLIIRAMAQNFSNVHQTTPPSAGGTWMNLQTVLPPFGATTTSAANHMVVDGVNIYNGYSALHDYAASGDNTLIGFYPGSGNNPWAGMSYAAGAASVDMSWNWTPDYYGHGHGMYVQEMTGGKLIGDNLVYDQVAYAAQFYGTSGSGFIDSNIEGNLFVRSGLILGGLSGFVLTDTVFQDNYTWALSTNVGYTMADLDNFAVTDNYLHNAVRTTLPATWDALSMTGNTFVGPTTNFGSGDFPTNTYYTLGSPPTTNVVVVRANAHETNRANVYVFNWENLTSVAVDLSSAVANGTPIFVMNAQDYYNTPVWSGTYNGGTIPLPMTGLTAAAAVGSDYTPPGPTGQSFNAFIVRAKANEYWRLLA